MHPTPNPSPKYQGGEWYGLVDVDRGWEHHAAALLEEVVAGIKLGLETVERLLQRDLSHWLIRSAR